MQKVVEDVTRALRLEEGDVRFAAFGRDDREVPLLSHTKYF